MSVLQPDYPIAGIHIAHGDGNSAPQFSRAIVLAGSTFNPVASSFSSFVIPSPVPPCTSSIYIQRYMCTRTCKQQDHDNAVKNQCKSALASVYHPFKIQKTAQRIEAHPSFAHAYDLLVCFCPIPINTRTRRIQNQRTEFTHNDTLS